MGNNSYTIATDAASTFGYGLVFGPQWTFGQWEPEVLTCHIMVLELYPIVLAVKLFSNSLCNKSVLILTDNEALVPIINKGTSKDSQIMKLIRIMVVQCLRDNILIRAQHIPGSENLRPDSLSRLQVKRFWCLSKGITTNPKPVSEAQQHAAKLGQLLEGALSLNTKKVYKHAWNNWWEFMASTFKVRPHVLELPLDPSLVALFIGYLANKELKASTMSTHLSALSYIHKIFNVDTVTSLPFIQNITRFYHRMSKHSDTRLPITIPLLVQLVTSLPHVCKSAYMITLLSMYLTAFFACLRIGEITSRGQNKQSLIQFNNLSLNETSFQLHFYEFKHNLGKYHRVQVIKQDIPICPIQAMIASLKVKRL